MLSSNQVMRTAETVEAQRVSDNKRRNTDSRLEQELRNLAAWNAQKTIVGGVEMTNAEAQAARQHVIDHEDEYADRAVREGRIHAGEEEAYKQNNRRLKELNDRIGRKSATNDEKIECEQRTNSRLGQAGGYDFGDAHKSVSLQSNASTKVEKDNLRGTAASAVYGESFQVAIQPTQEFNRSASGATSLQPVKEEPAPAPSHRIQAMNLGV